MAVAHTQTLGLKVANKVKSDSMREKNQRPDRSHFTTQNGQPAQTHREVLYKLTAPVGNDA